MWLGFFLTKKTVIHFRKIYSQIFLKIIPFDIDDMPSKSFENYQFSIEIKKSTRRMITSTESIKSNPGQVLRESCLPQVFMS